MNDLHPGTPIGEYVIEGKVGEGSMGEVYRAVHPFIGKRAAVKVMRGSLTRSPDAVARFTREAQAVGRLGHPNIIDAFSFGCLPDGRCYLVMEWLQGESLATRLARGPLGFIEACELFEQACHALESAHANGIIHRDLKPDNIFLSHVPGGTARIKLLDFGVAKLAEVQEELTRTGALVGTPAYVSPEQARSSQLDWRTDIYSLGVVLFHALSGRLPFEAPGMAVLGMHLKAMAPRIRQLRPDIPPRIDELLARMLEKDPTRRPMLREVRHALIEARRAPAAAEQLATGTPRPAAPPAPPPSVPRMPTPVPHQTPPHEGVEMSIDELIASLPREALPSADAIAALSSRHGRTPPQAYAPPQAPRIVLPPLGANWRWAAAGFGLAGAVAGAVLLFLAIARDPNRGRKNASDEPLEVTTASVSASSAVAASPGRPAARRPSAPTRAAASPSSGPIVEGLGLQADLPKDPDGTIVVQIDDLEAQIALDGVTMPRAGRALRLPVRDQATHRVTITRRDRPPVEHMVSVAPGQTVDVVVTDEPPR